MDWMRREDKELGKPNNKNMENLIQKHSSTRLPGGGRQHDKMEQDSSAKQSGGGRKDTRK
jgi:hypothetical protein